MENFLDQIEPVIWGAMAIVFLLIPLFYFVIEKFK